MTTLAAALILIAVALGFSAGYFFRRLDFEAGRIAGKNEERSYANARHMNAWQAGHQQGVHFAFEHHDALMSRRAGNVASTPISIGNRMPPKAEQRCQAVGGNAEGKAPTIAAA